MDHSAVTTAQQGVYISKWNEWPLMQHAWNYSPYGTSNLKYYARHFITGPPNTGVATGEVIYNDSMYTLNNPAPGSGSIIWNVTGPFTFTTVSGNPAKIIISKTAGTGSGTLTATANGMTATHPLVVVNAQITGPATLYGGQTNVCYYLPHTGTTYSWTTDNNILIMSPYYTNTDVFYDVPYVWGKEKETIRCTVTLNGIPNYFSKAVTINP